jgi:uncharacterized membrane protein
MLQLSCQRHKGICTLWWSKRVAPVRSRGVWVVEHKFVPLFIVQAGVWQSCSSTMAVLAHSDLKKVAR